MDVEVTVYGIVDSMGTLGNFCWLCLVIRGLLVCIDMIDMENSKENKKLWKLLDKELFRKEGIVKICHDLRRFVDYSFHVYGVTIRNAFDTQVFIFSIALFYLIRQF